MKKPRLEISGSVARPRTLTFADLAGYSAKEVPATIECSGNSKQPQLMNGLVSNGMWTGPQLGPLLRDCGVLAEAREVVFFGADLESERKWPAADRTFDVPHGRSIFIQDALNSGAILALQLNGRALPVEHGFPLRLVLPGWYGMAQVKWLSRDRGSRRQVRRPQHGTQLPFDTHSARQSRTGNFDGRNRLKSVVANVTGAALSSGAAWGGPNPIERVEVRIDNQPWREAAFTQKNASDARLDGYYRGPAPHWACTPSSPARSTHEAPFNPSDTRGRALARTTLSGSGKSRLPAKASENDPANRTRATPLPALACVPCGD